ncbi:hypothetical protein T492DRAFT_890606 [Pavlovales sp. CCMP2436]|nr:hypothetical protein T492DRAFT_890606 [Pavlovales sp. CCMP2436]
MWSPVTLCPVAATMFSPRSKMAGRLSGARRSLTGGLRAVERPADVAQPGASEARKGAPRRSLMGAPGVCILPGCPNSRLNLARKGQLYCTSPRCLQEEREHAVCYHLCQLVFPVAPFFCPACVSRASRACSPKTPISKEDAAFGYTSEDMLDVKELAEALLTTRAMAPPPEVAEGLCFAYFYGGNSAAQQAVWRCGGGFDAAPNTSCVAATVSGGDIRGGDAAGDLAGLADDGDGDGGSLHDIQSLVRTRFMPAALFKTQHWLQAVPYADVDAYTLDGDVGKLMRDAVTRIAAAIKVCGGLEKLLNLIEYTRPYKMYALMGVSPMEAAARIKKQLIDTIGTIAARGHAQLLLARLSALAPIAAQRGNKTNSNQQIISLNALARAHYRRSIGTRGGAQASAAD